MTVRLAGYGAGTLTLTAKKPPENGEEAATADVTRLRLGLEGTWQGLEAGGGHPGGLNPVLARVCAGSAHAPGDAALLDVRDRVRLRGRRRCPAHRSPVHVWMPEWRRAVAPSSRKGVRGNPGPGRQTFDPTGRAYSSAEPRARDCRTARGLAVPGKVVSCSFRGPGNRDRLVADGGPKCNDEVIKGQAWSGVRIRPLSAR